MTEKMPLSQLIEGKVASVLNEREIAINIGEEKGVQVGMKFKVLADKPTEIIDPENGNILGEIDREKVKVQAIEVQKNFSICRTYKTRYTGGGSLYSLVSASLVGAPKEEYETLKFEDSSLPPPLSEEDSYVKKGDRVVQDLLEK